MVSDDGRHGSPSLSGHDVRPSRDDANSPLFQTVCSSGMPPSALAHRCDTAHTEHPFRGQAVIIVVCNHGWAGRPEQADEGVTDVPLDTQGQSRDPCTVTDTVSSAELDAILASIFMTPEGKADPYPGFATVREAVQIHHSALGLKVATRYKDVNAILRDNRFGRGAQRSTPRLFNLTQEEFDERFPDAGGINESMLGLDPPDHTRLRGLVAKAFTPNTVEQLKPEIQRLTDMLLDPLEGDVDLMPALALKLPITVIGQMLGVPETDYADLMPHIKIVIRSLATFEANLDEFAEIYAASNVIGDYFRELADEKRKHPDDGMFTDLVHAEDAGDKLSERELIAIGDSPVRRRLRNDDQPDRQRHTGVAAPSRPAAASTTTTARS